MKLAIIAPIHNLEMVKKGTMAMALTHLVLKDENYAAFYKELDMFKLLDNSAFEGQLNSIENVVKAAQIISANEIVLPDIIFDAAKTIDATERAIDYLVQNNINNYKLMAVVQGSTEKEWWQCFDYFNKHTKIATIGLSKLSCPKAFNSSVTNARLKITRTIAEKGLVSKTKQYHLLGGSYEFVSEISLQPSWIRSIDTSIICEASKRRKRIDKLEKELPKANLDVGLKKWNISYFSSNLNIVNSILKERK